MARNQKNYSYFTYVDDSTTPWNLRGESGGAASAVDGNAVSVGTQNIWHRTKRNQPRKIIYMDATTGRTIDPVFYTTAAFNAVAIGDIVAVQVAGLATTVNYAAIRKVGEKKQGTPNFSRHLADA